MRVFTFQGSPTPEALAPIQLRSTTMRQVKVWRSQIYRSWSRLWSGIKRIVQTGKSWFSFMRRPVGEISISSNLAYLFIFTTYHISIFYVYPSIPAPRLVQMGVASTSLVSTLLSHDIWIIVVKFMIWTRSPSHKLGATHQGLMEMWKANYPSDIQDLEHCMTATPRREDVDKFIIRKAVDAAKRG